MDCGIAPYPSLLAINTGGSCCIDALPENTIRRTVDEYLLQPSTPR